MKETKITLPEDYVLEMQEMLGDNYKKYEESLQAQPFRGLRLNTKKISVENFLKEYNLKLKKLNYASDGFIFESDEKIGNNYEHLSGLIYLQEPSSMIPVCSSGIEDEKEPLKVLDLCASPGGKTGQIAMRVSEDSLIISNEIVSSRAQVLHQNIERQGLKNVIVTNESPDRLKVFENYFDYVFVDAPCSGQGMFRKTPETILEWSKEIEQMCANRQKEILTIAEKLVKPNGTLVYSTCTFSKLEDEDVTNWFLDNFNFKLVDVPKLVKDVTLACKIKGKDYARKFLPHTGDGEGQYVAVMKKFGEESADKLYSKKHFKSVYEIGQADNKLVQKFLVDNLTQTYSWKRLFVVGQNVFLAPEAFDGKLQTALDDLKFVSLGVKLGSIEKGRFEPNHSMFMALADEFKTKIELTGADAKKYLHGEELVMADVPSGYAVITKNGFAIGGAKVAGGRLKNLYPKGLRIWNIH